MIAILLELWKLIKEHWYIAAIVVLFLFVVIGFGLQNACNRTPKLNEKEINKAQQAIATKDREEMQKILVTSDLREKGIDTDLATAKAEQTEAVNQAKRRTAQMTNEELAAELERLAKEK
jgi:hypothetical protein